MAPLGVALGAPASANSGWNKQVHWGGVLGAQTLSQSERVSDFK